MLRTSHTKNATLSNSTLFCSRQVSSQYGFMPAASACSPVGLPCAGNSGISLRQEVPAACPGTLVVTAISDNDGTVGAADTPPSWSNYLPLPDADNITARMLAAPGKLQLGSPHSHYVLVDHHQKDGASGAMM
jgi:hypothetical protein